LDNDGTAPRSPALQRRRNVHETPGQPQKTARSRFTLETSDCTLRLERAARRSYVVRRANVAAGCLEYRHGSAQLHEAEP
jgi:hypothetical protein